MTRPAAGDRNKLIQFETPEITTNGLGQEVEGPWLPVTRAWAKLTYGGYGERREAAAEGQAQTGVFICTQSRGLRAITPRDRIVYNGGTWDIEGIALDRNDSIEFTAKLRRD